LVNGFNGKKVSWLPVGREKNFFDSEKIAVLRCNAIIDTMKNPGGEIWGPESCGTEYHFSKSGEVTKKITHPLQCNYGCGEFKPEMPPGEWRVQVTSLVIRDTPSIKGKKLGEIKRGELVKVTRDTQKIETISFETAPRVEIEYNGVKGFVFGGFLKDKSYPLVPERGAGWLAGAFTRHTRNIRARRVYTQCG